METAGLIFDVDGVIADTERVNFEVTRDVLAELFGVTGVRREDFAAGIGRGAAAYVRAAAEVHGRALSDEQTDRAVQLRQERFLAWLNDPNHSLPPFPGVIELMKAARADADWRVAIATSSNREKCGPVLRGTGVADLEIPTVAGDEVPRKKPDPSLFLIAANKIDVRPQRCVVIEDAPDGIKAAKAAGMRCVAVTNSFDAAPLHEADRIVDSLAAISLPDLVALLD